MSYIPPHARNIRTNKVINAPQVKPAPAKKVVQNDFPELVKQPVVIAKPALDFSRLFDENAEPVVKKEEMKRGLIKLTNTGIVDSLTPDEREEDDKMRTNRIITKNMIDYHNLIEKSRQTQIAHDHNYVPEQVINEYSTSESSYYSTEDSELNVESDDDSCEL
jgi:hypothetical protein